MIGLLCILIYLQIIIRFMPSSLYAIETLYHGIKKRSNQYIIIF